MGVICIAWFGSYIFCVAFIELHSGGRGPVRLFTMRALCATRQLLAHIEYKGREGYCLYKSKRSGTFGVSYFEGRQWLHLHCVDLSHLTPLWRQGACNCVVKEVPVLDKTKISCEQQRFVSWPRGFKKWSKKQDALGISMCIDAYSHAHRCCNAHFTPFWWQSPRNPVLR